MAAATLSTRQRRVFDSVFGGANNRFSQPTPVADFVAPGEAFGGPTRSAPNVPTKLRDQVRWDRSWHTITHTLFLPDLLPGLNPLKVLQSSMIDIDQLDESFQHALQDVLSPHDQVPLARQTEDIFVWHNQQVRDHFLRQILPLIEAADMPEAESLLSYVIEILQATGRLYTGGFMLLEYGLRFQKDIRSPELRSAFDRDLAAVISNTVTRKIEKALKMVLQRNVLVALGLPEHPGVRAPHRTTYSAEGAHSERARKQLMGLIDAMKNVGLAGKPLEIAFAETMNGAMSQYVNACKGLWSDKDLSSQIKETEFHRGDVRHMPRTAQHTAPSRCMANLCVWVTDRYAKLAVQVLDALQVPKVGGDHIPLDQVEKWKEMAIGHIAALRIEELFDIISSSESSAALTDLRTSITTPQRRLHLTDVFSSALKERLLHPGASTLQILQTYIAMIKSFHQLDHSRVLLDRVAYPLQLYLCTREDTVRVIITGLLADTLDAQGNLIPSGGDKLVELARLLNKGKDQVGSRSNDDELDWHDMQWQPDPVDAGAGYQRSKSADIIGTLIGVLGSQDVFIKEFQNIVGENLLKNDGHFEKEIKVLELLKVRFGEAPLQACEVMLKDIQDSGRVNASIRKDQKLDPSEAEVRAANEMLHRFIPESEAVHIGAEGLLKPSLNAKILSRLFWPQLHNESYRIPDIIAELQTTYEEGFQSLKASRKLTWLHALGQATVELELEDRTILEEVHTWQATVIWAFQGDGVQPERRSVSQLVKGLNMDEALVHSALKFWVNKIVLHEVEKDVFEVLETLNKEDRARSNAQAAAPIPSAPEDDAVMTSDASISAEKGEVYWKFVQGMLKNASSQMPLHQIGMMLKMLVPDAFPHSNEELQELLSAKIGLGELEFVGGKYKLKK